jgi:hypothetical protein
VVEEPDDGSSIYPIGGRVSTCYLPPRSPASYCTVGIGSSTLQRDGESGFKNIEAMFTVDSSPFS